MHLCRIIDARIEDPFPVLRQRLTAIDLGAEKVVSQIIDDVRQRGDAALLDSARKFDAPELKSILVTDEELATAELPEMFRSAIRQAVDRIERFHVLQLAHFTQGLEPEKGAFGWQRENVGQRVLPLQTVGVYVPGGKATYPSSVLMNSIPARSPGVDRMPVVTIRTARPDGTLAPSVTVGTAALRHRTGFQSRRRRSDCRIRIRDRIHSEGRQDCGTWEPVRQ